MLINVSIVALNKSQSRSALQIVCPASKGLFELVNQWHPRIMGELMRFNVDGEECVIETFEPATPEERALWDERARGPHVSHDEMMAQIRAMAEHADAAE